MNKTSEKIIEYIDYSKRLNIIDTYGIGDIQRGDFKKVIVIAKKLPVGLKQRKGFVGVIPDYFKTFYQLNKNLKKLQDYFVEDEYKTSIQNAFSLTGDLRIFVERAGLGSKGANELILNPDYGANLIYAVLFTDYEQLPSSKRIDDVCNRCYRCWEACPGNALGPEGLSIKRCLPYSLRACQECVDACPVGKVKLKK